MCRHILAFLLLSLSIIGGASAAIEAVGLRAPLHFEPDPSTDGLRFVARGAAYGFSVSASHLQIGMDREAVLRIGLDGAMAREPEGAAPLHGASHYLRLDAEQSARTHVPHYAQVVQRERYPGIDLVTYGNGQEIEYDFVLAPGADPDRIALRIEGADWAGLASDGDLHLRLGDRTLVQRAPVAYQPSTTAFPYGDGPQPQDTRVEARYRIDRHGLVRFVLGDYDPKRPLVIDPILVYTTLLGGEDGDFATSIAVASDGSAVVAGYTRSADFPLRDGLPESPPRESGANGFVTRFTPDGSDLVFSTWLGGLLEDGVGELEINDIALDAEDRVWVVGSANEAEDEGGGGQNKRSKALESKQAFVLRLSADGSDIEWLDLFGGWADEDAHGIALGTDGAVYVCGATASDDFPLLDARDASKGGIWDAFLRKYEAADDSLSYSTFIGGDGIDMARDCAVGPDRQPVIVGHSYDEEDISGMGLFALKLSQSGSGSLLYSHLRYGGTGLDSAQSVAIDASGNALVAGMTESSDFPVLEPVQAHNAGMSDQFLMKLGPTGTVLAATYYGTAQDENTATVALDSASRPYLAGRSGDHPALVAFDVGLGRIRYELGFMNFPGTHGAISALALGSDDRLFLGGVAFHEEGVPFPTSPGAFDATRNGDTDVFVAKISPQPPQINASNQSIEEGEGGPRNIEVTVQLTPIAIVQTPVPWQAVADTATAPEDFAAASGTLVFAPGESIKTITLTVNGDMVAEADESFLVRFEASSLAQPATPEIRITLHNDDVPPGPLFRDGFE